MPDAREGAGTEADAEDGVVVVGLGDDDGDDDPDDTRVHVLEVWSCNLNSVQVFQLCNVRGIGHMGGVYWQDIEIAEIRAALELLELPHELWAGITWDVRHMGRCVANVRNQEAVAKAKRRPGS